MYENDLKERLQFIREQKNISARDLSLQLGKNEGYINSIENGKIAPSYKQFCTICEELGVSPEDFFSRIQADSSEYYDAIKKLKVLSPTHFSTIKQVIDTLYDSLKSSRG